MKAAKDARFVCKDQCLGCYIDQCIACSKAKSRLRKKYKRALEVIEHAYTADKNKQQID